jgi:hypothetical protein
MSCFQAHYLAAADEPQRLHSMRIRIGAWSYGPAGKIRTVLLFPGKLAHLSVKPAFRTRGC